MTGACAFVAVRINPDAEKLQTLTDAQADGGGVFPDPSGKDQGVQAAQDRGQGTQILLGLIAEQGDGLGGMPVRGFSFEQVAHVRADPRNPEQPGLLVDQFVQRGRRHPPFDQQVQEDAGIEVAGAGAHHEAAGGRETHRRIDADPAAHRRHARPVAEVGDDDAALGLFGGPGRGVLA